jgi:hypothetical protein
MINKITCQDLVITELLANLPVGFLAKNIRYPNSPFIMPIPTTDLNKNTAIKFAWLDVSMQDSTSAPQSPLRQIRAGLLSFDVYWPKLVGNVEALKVAEHISATFANKWLGEILKINLGTITEFEARDWYNLNITFDYFYEG